ncbi:MAG: ABC transporter substrate-binding protein [Thermofilaceae archaeon]
MVLAKKTLILIIVVIALIAAIVGSIGYFIGYHMGSAIIPAGEAEFPKGILKIGLLAPLTGPLASEGEGFKWGAEWAIEEINKLGGICGYKLELVIGDTKDLEPGHVTTVMEKLITQDKVAAIFTGYGTQALVELDIAAKYNILYFFGADWMAHQAKWAEYPEKYITCFNLVPSYMPYRWHFPQTFDRWVKEGKIQIINNKVAIVYSDNYYSSWIAEGLKEEFEKLGYIITLFERVPFGTITEWGSILAKIRANPPGLIINTDYIPSNEAAFVRQFLEAPTKSHIFIQYAPWVPEFTDLLGDKANGILFNSPALSVYVSKNEIGQELLRRGIERFGKEPPGYTFTVYQELFIYKQGVELANAWYNVDPNNPNDWPKIAEVIKKFTAWRGVYGMYVFDETNCLSEEFTTPTIYQIWDGKRLCIEPIEYADAEVRMPPWWETGTGG